MKRCINVEFNCLGSSLFHLWSSLFTCILSALAALAVIVKTHYGSAPLYPPQVPAGHRYSHLKPKRVKPWNIRVFLAKQEFKDFRTSSFLI
jgi:hypothetical protein